MAERTSDTGYFWSTQVLKLGELETEWFNERMLKYLDFSASGELDNHAEKTIGNRICLCGPIMDSFLEEIGRSMLSNYAEAS